jgi:CheY-like chemotaxis protein
LGSSGESDGAGQHAFLIREAYESNGENPHWHTSRYVLQIYVESDMAATHVLLADRTRRVRDALEDLLRASGTTGAIEGVTSLESAVERVEREPVDMVLVELSSTSQHELENLVIYRKQYPGVSWVVVSLFPDMRTMIEDRLQESGMASEMLRVR